MITVTSNNVDYKFDMQTKKYRKFFAKESFTSGITHAKITHRGQEYNIEIPVNASNINVGKVGQIIAKVGGPAGAPADIGECIWYTVDNQHVNCILFYDGTTDVQIKEIE